MLASRCLALRSTRLSVLSVSPLTNKALNNLRSLDRKLSKKVQEHDKIVTVPNLLCVGRIAASPYLAYSIVNGELVLSLGIFCLAGLSDLVSFDI